MPMFKKIDNRLYRLLQYAKNGHFHTLRLEYLENLRCWSNSGTGFRFIAKNFIRNSGSSSWVWSFLKFSCPVLLILKIKNITKWQLMTS